MRQEQRVSKGPKGALRQGVCARACVRVQAKRRTPGGDQRAASSVDGGGGCFAATSSLHFWLIWYTVSCIMNSRISCSLSAMSTASGLKTTSYTVHTSPVLSRSSRGGPSDSGMRI